MNAIGAEHDADEIGGVFSADLFHDAGAMHFDGTRANAELAPGLFVRSASRDLTQDLALARSKALVAGKLARQNIAESFFSAPHAGLHCFSYAQEDVEGIEGFFDQIVGAVLDRFH